MQAPLGVHINVETVTIFASTVGVGCHSGPEPSGIVELTVYDLALDAASLSLQFSAPATGRVRRPVWRLHVKKAAKSTNFFFQD